MEAAWEADGDGDGDGEDAVGLAAARGGGVGALGDLPRPLSSDCCQPRSAVRTRGACWLQAAPLRACTVVDVSAAHRRQAAADRFSIGCSWPF